MSWTLNGSPVSDWKIASARLSIVSQGTDVLSVRFLSPCDEPPIAAGTSCQLKWNDDVIFAGRAILPGATGESRGESSDLYIRGPFGDMEGIIYCTGTGENTTTRLRFPSDPTSTEAVTLSDAVAEVLSHSVDRGANFTIGTIDLDGELPSMEFDALPVSQILINLLRLSPGAAVWFDYNTAPKPTIHVRAASSLPALSIAGPGCAGLKVDQRTDLAIPGTKLVFRKLINSSYGSAEGVVVDSAGSPSAIGALIMPLDLGAANVQYEAESNKVKVAPVQPDLASWWQIFIPDRTVASVYSHSETGDGSLTHFVTAGQLPSWMLSEIDGEANADPNGCAGPLASSPFVPPVASHAFREADNPPPLHLANSLTFKIGRRRFNAVLAFEVGEATEYQGYTLDLPCTDCSASGAFYRETLGSWDAGEPVPSGLASAFQSSCERLGFSGSFRVKQLECTPATHRPGNALNITGTAQGAWASMQSPIQRVDHNLLLGETAMQFGPADHLGPPTLLEIARAARSRNTPVRVEATESTEPEDVNYQAVAASASESGGGDSTPATASLTVNCTDEDGNAFPDGAFTVNGQSGTSGATITLAPGGYTIVFLPVAGRKTPGSLSGTIAADGTETRTGQYKWADEIYLEDQFDPSNWTYLIGWGEGMSLTMVRDGDSMILSPDGVGIFKSDGRQAFISSEGWLQLIAGEEAEKQIYIDAGVLPASDSEDEYGFRGYQGFGSIVTGEQCE